MDLTNVVVKHDPRAMQARIDLAIEVKEKMACGEHGVSNSNLRWTVLEIIEAIIQGDQTDCLHFSVVNKHFKTRFPPEHPVWEFVNNKKKYQKWHHSLNGQTGKWTRTLLPTWVPHDQRPKGWML